MTDQPPVPGRPAAGFGIIGYVLTRADTDAEVGGVVRLAVGTPVFPYFLADRTQPRAHDREGA